MQNICNCLSDLYVENAKFLYDNFNIVFCINDGEIVGVIKE